MALDFTLSETTLRHSVRRFFVDTFYTGLSIETFFDKISRVPKIAGIEISRWISIHMESLNLETMASGFFQVWCFTRRDIDFTELAILRDLVYEQLIDLSKTDGIKRIIFYDSSWVDTNHKLLVIPGNEFGPEEIEDGTNAQIIPVTLRWGAK